MVQRRAARFATYTYSREPGMVTSILNTLGWPSLQSRRKTTRLTLMIKLPLAFHLTSEDPPDLHGNITLTNSPRAAGLLTVLLLSMGIGVQLIEYVPSFRNFL
jgi:hypothetical protein